MFVGEGCADCGSCCVGPSGQPVYSRIERRFARGREGLESPGFPSLTLRLFTCDESPTKTCEIPK